MRVPYHVGYSCSIGSWYCVQGRPGFGDCTQSFIETKVEDLRRARVLNFEMETSCLFTLYGLRGSSVCTAFANRNKDKFAYGGIERSIRVLSNNKTNNGAYNPNTAEHCQEFVFDVVRECIRDLKTQAV